MKSGFVSLIGRTNAGKSSFLNYILGEKISLVSHKVNATRRKINGIVMHGDDQIIFVDTPGLHESNKMMNKIMVEVALNAIGDSDLVLFLAPIHDSTENYEKFLDERRKLLAKSANDFLNSLLDNKVDKVEITDYANRKGVLNDINEDEKMLELSYWMEEKGLSGGEINYELQLNDNESIIIDLAWPDGIQNNLSEPVAIMIDEESNNIRKVNLQKYRVFEDIESFKDYIKNNYLERN